MKARVLSCSKCQTSLASPAFYNTGRLEGCPTCGTRARIELFPAYFRAEVSGPKAENVVVESESSCFYHPQKKAVIPCEGCGRFLCALCDVDLNGQHLCPVCLERGQHKRVLPQLENQRVRYDSLALLVALGPLLIWPMTILTAPAAVFFALRHWKSPTSLVRPNRRRLVGAIILASVQIAGWIIGLSYAFTR